MTATAPPPEHHHHDHSARARPRARAAAEAGPRASRHLSPGVVFLTAMIAPVALVGILFSASDADNGGYVCPLREATGIPCPACGATRAFFHLANGDNSRS